MQTPFVTVATAFGCAALGYLCGSFPTGVVIARRRGIDLRTVGSGNVGATNVSRALGRRFGLLVLLIDAGKGALPVLAARYLHASPWAFSAAGLGAVLGHVFSLFLRGRGGKGVATALGASVALSPLPALSALGVYALLYLPWRISSVGSLGAAIAFPLLLFLWPQPHPAVVTYAVLSGAVIVLRHRDNIARLRSGKELRG